MEKNRAGKENSDGVGGAILEALDDQVTTCPKLNRDLRAASEWTLRVYEESMPGRRKSQVQQLRGRNRQDVAQSHQETGVQRHDQKGSQQLNGTRS